MFRAVLEVLREGPPWRGQVDVAIGVAGIKPIRDRRGEAKLYG